jgi:uncharacterized protein YunC (DUF1805 family)
VGEERQRRAVRVGGVAVLDRGAPAPHVEIIEVAEEARQRRAVRVRGVAVLDRGAPAPHVEIIEVA